MRIQLSERTHTGCLEQDLAKRSGQSLVAAVITTITMLIVLEWKPLH